MKQKSCICFPQDFKLRGNLVGLAESGDIPRLMASLSDASLMEQLAGIYPNTKHVRIEHGGFVANLILNGWHIYAPPKPSNSKESLAVYYARSLDMNHGLLLYFLAEDSMTSDHFHKVSTETYYLIAGKVEITLGGSTIVPLTMSGERVVSILPTSKTGEETTHPVKTGSEPAIILIHLQDCPSGLSMEDHYYSDGTRGSRDQWDR